MYLKEYNRERPNEASVEMKSFYVNLQSKGNTDHLQNMGHGAKLDLVFKVIQNHIRLLLLI